MDDKLQKGISRGLPEADPALNSDPDFNRRIAAVVFDIHSSALKSCIEAISAMSRWMLTALVAINGGAAVAIAGVQVGAIYKIVAGGSFVVGILLAFAASLTTVLRAPKMLEPLGNAMGYWLTVQDDGERISEDIEGLQDEADAAMKAARLPMVLAGLSLFLFVFGAVAIGCGLLMVTQTAG